MSKDGVVDVVRASITEIEGIGGVRRHRLERDLGITNGSGMGDVHFNVISIRNIAEASIDELTQIRSIGELTAMRIKGRAQGLCNAYDEWVEQRREKIRPDPDKPDGWVGRVAVVFGDITDEDGNLPDGVTPQKLRKTVRDALDDADVVLDSDSEVGFVGGWSQSDEFGEAGGRIVSEWLDWTATMGNPVNRKQFQTPWSKYSKWCNFGYTDDIGQTLDDVPFDTPRGEADVQSWMAPAERTQKMVQWADEVVIPVDGEYGDRVRDNAMYNNTPCTTFLELDEDAGFHPYTPDPEADPRETDAREGITGKAGTTVGANDGVVQEEKVDVAEYANSRDPREGSPDDLDPDVLEAGVTTRDDHWPDDDETAGGGVGSNSDRSGERNTRFST